MKRWLIGFVLVYVLVSGYVVFSVYAGAKTLMRAQQIVSDIKDLGEKKDIAGVSERLQILQGLFSQPPVLWPVIPIPEFLTYQQLEKKIFSLGEKGTLLAIQALEQVGDLSLLTDEKRGKIISLVDAQRQEIKNIHKELGEVLSLGRKAWLGPLSTTQKEQVTHGLVLGMSVYEQSKDWLPFLDVAPALVGYPQDKKFLLLLQNNDELRATGGFIGTYGVLTLHQGQVKDLYTDNVYNLDEQARDLHIPSPWPIAKYVKMKDWKFRDANWDPDFPTTATTILDFYQKERGKEKNLSGVIAITPEFVKDLLDIVGSITVEGRTYTSDSVVEILQYQVEKEFYEKGIPVSDRKDIIHVLAQELKNKLFALSLDRYPDMLKVLQKAIVQKHILFFDTDPQIQEVYASRNMHGALQNTNGDYFMVVDSNLGALKTDAVMKRDVSYLVSPQPDGRLRATLSIGYTNTGTFTWKTTRYRTYTRVYVPSGSQLLKSVGVMDMDRSKKEGEVEIVEGDKTQLGAFIAIEPGETRTLTFEYVLPPRISMKDYTLYAQTQPGRRNTSLTVYRDFGTKTQPLTLPWEKDEIFE